MAISTVAQGLSFVQYEADGVVANYPLIFTYLEATDVKVYVDSDEVTYTYLNASEVTPDVLPTAGQIVTIRRFTESNQRLVNFEDGGQLSADLLDQDSNQNFYLAQEAQDVSNFGLGVDPLNFTVDAKGNRLINIADGVDPTDGINMSQIAGLITAVNTAGSQAAQSAQDAADALTAAVAAQAAADAIEGIAQDALDTVTALEATVDASIATAVADQAVLTTAEIASAVAGIVDSSPTTLDTLNELAAALGDDPNFATTITTALGNRVRVDTDAQGLTSPQKVNAKTNLDLQNVDNTSDATKNSAAATLTNKTISGADNTFTLIPAGSALSGQVPIVAGGTGQSTKGAGFDALSPMTDQYDMIYGGVSGTGIRLPKGTPGQFLVAAAGTSEPTWSSVSPGAMQVAILYDSKASGTSGGTFTAGAWYDRDINTLIDPNGIVTSLTSNIFTLNAGTYFIEASAPGDAVAGHAAKLLNFTTTSDTIIGVGAYAPPSLNTTSRSLIIGQFTIATSTQFKIQHRCTNGVAGEGRGRALSIPGVSETYTFIKLTKIS